MLWIKDVTSVVMDTYILSQPLDVAATFTDDSPSILWKKKQKNWKSTIVYKTFKYPQDIVTAMASLLD